MNLEKNLGQKLYNLSTKRYFLYLFKKTNALQYKAWYTVESLLPDSELQDFNRSCDKSKSLSFVFRLWHNVTNSMRVM